MSLKTEDDGTVWMYERLHTGYGTTYRVEQTLFDSNTPHQRLVVGKTAGARAHPGAWQRGKRANRWRW